MSPPTAAPRTFLAADHSVARAVRVLDMDPDLGATMTPERFGAARAQLVAQRYEVPRGPWRDRWSAHDMPGAMGLLLLEGVFAREVLLEDNVSAELLGAGDLIRPWRPHGPSRLLGAEIRWTVLEPVRFALLGSRFAVAAAPYPELNAAVFDRLVERAQRLALTQAISQLNGIDRRLISLFWHLAERWGTVGLRGVTVPLVLPHRFLASLIGARRPTVSTALGRLAARGELERLPDGTWLVHGTPDGVPTAPTARVVQFRRPVSQAQAVSAR